MNVTRPGLRSARRKAAIVLGLIGALGLIAAGCGGDDDDGRRPGWFELGRSPMELQKMAAPQVRAIKPEEGLMLLFPAYFYHGTVPFESAQRRISIAFDVVPEG